MLVRPGHQRADGVQQGMAQRGERIVDARRHDRVHGPADDAVPFQAAEGDGQHPLADAVDGALQHGESPRAFAQAEDDEQRPLVADPVEDFPYPAPGHAGRRGGNARVHWLPPGYSGSLMCRLAQSGPLSRGWQMVQDQYLVWSSNRHTSENLGDTMTAQAVEIPGYIAGTWDIDPVHSHIGFVARHLMVSKVRGNFTKVEGQIITADNPLESSATATIDMTSFNTGNEQRDGDVKGENFLDVANHPTMTYRTTGIRQDGEINRTDWGITANMALPTGGVVVGERIQLVIEVEASLKTQ